MDLAQQTVHVLLLPGIKILHRIFQVGNPVFQGFQFGREELIQNSGDPQNRYQQKDQEDGIQKGIIGASDIGSLLLLSLKKLLKFLLHGNGVT